MDETHRLRRMPAYINPLSLIEIDFSGPDANESTVTAETILDFLHAPVSNKTDVQDTHQLAQMVARYKKIADSSVKLQLAPAHPFILERFVWPMRHAMGSYIVGNYLSTISLCGAVAEWLAIQLFDMAAVKTNGKQISDKDQKYLYGSKFEKLGQERRLEVLAVYGIIDDDAKSTFKRIKDIRNDYLHFLSRSHESMAAHAVETFHATVKLVTQSFFIAYPNGTVELQPLFHHWLEQHGALEEDT